MLHLKLHSFSFKFIVFAIFTVCHFLCSLMTFDCQEIKGLFTYLLTRNIPDPTNRISVEYLYPTTLSPLSHCQPFRES